jgi:hypothetical protein
MRTLSLSPRKIERLALSLSARRVYALMNTLQEFVAAIDQRLQNIQDALKDALPGVTQPGKWATTCVVGGTVHSASLST